MVKYIDADLLRKEIERQKSLFSTEKEKEGLSKIDKLSLGARIASLEETIVLIDSLQQEQPGILKSWRPSEEQMKDLYLAVSQLYSVNHPFIKSLYEDLKKLM